MTKIDKLLILGVTLLTASAAYATPIYCDGSTLAQINAQTGSDKGVCNVGAMSFYFYSYNGNTTYDGSALGYSNNSIGSFPSTTSTSDITVNLVGNSTLGYGLAFTVTAPNSSNQYAYTANAHNETYTLNYVAALSGSGAISGVNNQGNNFDVAGVTTGSSNTTLNLKTQVKNPTITTSTANALVSEAKNGVYAGSSAGCYTTTSTLSYLHTVNNCLTYSNTGFTAKSVILVSDTLAATSPTTSHANLGSTLSGTNPNTYGNGSFMNLFVTPEPVSTTLIGSGLLLLGLVRRRRNRR